MYEKILNDKLIIKIYDDISIFEDKEKAWAHHDLIHVTNVANMLELILKQLGYKDDYIDEAKVAALLHDIGCIKGKENHAIRSAIMAEKYLEDNNIKLKYKNEVIDSIKNHSSGFDEENIMTLCLIFCDKLDIKKSRITKNGYNVIGMRQFRFIDDIIVFIVDDNVQVNFIINNDVDLKELEKFYFIDKVFKAIDCFSKKINKKAIIKINNNVWQR